MASREDPNPALGKSYGAELARHTAPGWCASDRCETTAPQKRVFLLTVYCHL
jgi:hypothetical protein